MPKNILFLILSEQAYPNVLSAKIFKPNIIIYMLTKKMKELNVDEHFKKAIELNNGYEYKYVPIYIDEDLDIYKIKSKIEEIWAKYENDNWIINITGGTKILSIAAYSFFENKNQEVIYFPNNSDHYIKLKNNDEIEKIPIPEHDLLKVNELLTSYGVKIINSNEDIKAKQKKDDLSLYIALNINDDKVTNFLSYIMAIKIKQNNDIIRSKGVYISNDIHNKLKNEYPEMFKNVVSKIIDNILEKREYTISEDWVKFLTGGWLEHFVYMVINEIKDELKIQDLYMNMTIQHADKPQNELDVVFSKSDRLYIIECKSGEQSKEKGDEALYKLKAIKSSINALSISLNLVTTANAMHENKNDAIKKNIEERAQWYNINILPKKEVINLAKLYSTNNKEEISEKIKELFNIY